MAAQNQRSLHVLNSLVNKKVPFTPNKPKLVRWYSCGPTVYDVAHLGHARSYITFDIIRRILTDYFDYQVFYVMNITDIDDKIIKRARSQFLCDKFISNVCNQYDRDQTYIKTSDLLSKLEFALENYLKTNRAATTANDDNESNDEIQAKLKMLENVREKSVCALKILKELEKDSQNKQTQQLCDALHQLCDVIAFEEDSKHGHTVTDPEIFKRLAQKFENEFHNDMEQLNVMPPDALTRVSEYIDEVGKFLNRLEANGFAYRSPSGSVYFDTRKFNNDPKHYYAKLVPQAYKNRTNQSQESSQQVSDEKRSTEDFALWKKSKPGEPSWTTADYEPGRPGWHIECSVMATEILGECLDIHSGGCDLKFPHHDNEIAQSEAYYNTGNNWVNYFLHSGHLTISGCKMSKSLKNFITIRQALQEYTARELRFAFLAHGWAETLDYSPETMKIALNYQKVFRNFFSDVIDIFKEESKSDLIRPGVRKWSESDDKLNQCFVDAVDKVDKALCDNFNTRDTLNALCELISEFNRLQNSKTRIDSILLRKLSSYIQRMLHIFGANFTEFNLNRYFPAPNFLSASFGLPQGDQTKQAPGLSPEDLLDAVAKFRSHIKHAIKNDKPDTSVKDILKLCDQFRDKVLPDMGIQLQDKDAPSGEPSNYKIEFIGTDQLARERAVQEQAKSQNQNILQQRKDKMRIPPSEMFKSQLDKYSQFDSTGMPTHDAEGKEISASARKKLQRLYKEQETKYKKYLAEHGNK